jgi:hypothetical protein
MALIYNVKPFLDLGICKEYFMARKTTENGFSIRRKKTEIAVPPMGLQDTGISPNSSNDTPSNETQGSRNGKPLNPVPINHHAMSQAFGQQNSTPNGAVSADLEEEIRHRAYELYLERRAEGREAAGDPHQDWLTAEREILSRRTSRERKSA